MKLIIGLGNPGKDYENTRHNAGFIFVDKFAALPEIAPVGETLAFKLEKKFKAEIVETVADGEKFILAKPQTFMNASGEAVEKIFSYYDARLEDLIVVSDDIDLPVGTIRIRHEGSSAGQKGLQNIIDQLGTDKFLRVRIGMREDEESLQRSETMNYVLGKISKRAMPIVENSIEMAVEYIIDHIKAKQEIPAHTIEVKT